MKYIVLALTTISYLNYIDEWEVVYFLYISFAFLIAGLNAKHSSIVHLCFGLAIFKAVEFVAVFYSPMVAQEGEPYVWINTQLYLIHLLTDVIVLFFLFFRPWISYRCLYWLDFSKSKTPDYSYTRAETLIMAIISMYFVVDLTTMIENFIRNLDYLGFDEEFAKQFWHWTWMYDNYAYFKRTLNALELLMIWSTVNRMGRRRSKFRKKAMATLKPVTDNPHFSPVILKQSTD